MLQIAVNLENTTDLKDYKDASADEVILSLENATFSGCRSFSMSEITDLLKEAHALNMKVTVLFNRLFHEFELEKMHSAFLQLMKEGTDYIIFADPCVAMWAKEEGCMNKLIYDPVTLITSSEDAAFWSKLNLGYITLSPLCTKEEIAEMAARIPNASICAHGYQLMSASRRKLVSSYLKEKKMPADLLQKSLSLREEKRDYFLPVYETGTNTLIYNDFVQETFAHLKTFLSYGVKRIEVQSLRLTKEEVTDAIRGYRLIENGEDPLTIQKDYFQKHRNLNLSEGYYGWKTVK